MGNVVVNPYVFATSGDWSAWDGSADGSNQNSGLFSGNTGVLALNNTTFFMVNINGTSINSIVGTISGTSVSYGAIMDLNPGGGVNPQNISMALIDVNKVVVVFQNSSNGIGYAVVATVSGTSIMGGGIQQFANPGGGISTVTHNQQIAVITPTLAFVAYPDNNGADIISGVILSISGTTITVNTPSIIATGIGGSVAPSITSYDTNKVVMVYDKNSKATARIVNISGVNVSALGSEVQIDATSLSDTGTNVAIVSNSLVMANYTISANLRAVTLSLSGNVVSVNVPATIVNTSGVLSKWIEPLNSTQYMAIYNTGGSTEIAKILTVTGTVITSGSSVTVQSSGTTQGQQVSKIDNDTVVNGVFMGGKGQTKVLKRS